MKFVLYTCTCTCTCTMYNVGFHHSRWTMGSQQNCTCHQGVNAPKSQKQKSKAKSVKCECECDKPVGTGRQEGTFSKLTAYCQSVNCYLLLKWQTSQLFAVLGVSVSTRCIFHSDSDSGQEAVLASTSESVCACAWTKLVIIMDARQCPVMLLLHRQPTKRKRM